jgi:ribosomal protein S27E
MPTGTPLYMKCPKCRRGQYSYPRQVRGVRPTGKVEKRITRSAHCGHGSGGRAFYGHRGQVECLDCGHVWYSTHFDSGRKSCAP